MKRRTMGRWSEGTLVQFKPSPASAALYSRPPKYGTYGNVVRVNLGGDRRTQIPGPGGGIVYVKWSDGYIQGVSSFDLVKVKPSHNDETSHYKGYAENPKRPIGPHPGNPRNLEVGDAVQFRFEPETGGVIQRFGRDGYGLYQGWAWVDTRGGLRKVPTHALRLRRMSGTYDENPQPWARVFG